MNLVRAEWSRLTGRRFVQVMLVLLIVAFGITIATVLASSDRPSSQAWAEAEQVAAQERSSLESYRLRCLSAEKPDAPRELKNEFIGTRCDSIRPQDVRVENYLWGVFNFRQQILPLVAFLTAYLCFFGFLVSASFIGAELHSGSMTNLLLWRPQRLQVMAAKLGVLTWSLTVLFTAFSAVYVTTFWALAKTTGYVGNLEPGFWGDLTSTVLRAVGVSLLMSLVGFAIATIGRHTAAALGTLIGYFVLWEGGARIVMEVIGLRPNEQYFLTTHMGALLVGRLELWGCYNSYQDVCRYVIEWWHSGLLFLALTAAVLSAALVTFRRRDLI